MKELKPGMLLRAQYRTRILKFKGKISLVWIPEDFVVMFLKECRNPENGFVLAGENICTAFLGDFDLAKRN